MLSSQYFPLATIVAITSTILTSDASAMAMDRRQGPQPVTVTYEITNIAEADGPAFNIGASGGAGVTLSHSESYQVGYSISIGANLGLDIDEIFHLGISASISKDTSRGSTDGAGVACPAVKKGGGDQWTCSLSITPKLVVKTGTQDFAGTKAPYRVSFPRVTNENILFFEADLCACTNKKGSGSAVNSTLRNPTKHSQNNQMTSDLKEYLRSLEKPTQIKDYAL
ncbi:hypothetical protein G7Y89_g14169 [Cudoniella acicularis]|uniref:Uncharacterized protein n=1 Tax=Cudoniella acicularis TaxID=354080 RepID=A0A8H4R993_9HELO|nr:hypothetical protein G7Y89_g14169 [Cudoniella acicularis]